jgi:hypothetical protein
MNVTDTSSMTYTLPLGTHESDLINALRSENATLRACLIDVTGQRDALRQELDRVRQERVV